MALITISRQLGSGGERISEAVVRRLGYRLMDKEDILVAAEGYGFSRDELEMLNERRPGLRDRLFRERLSVYLDLLQCIIYSCALQGDVVILGTGGNMMLEGVPSLLRVKFIAPMEVRVRRVMEEENVAAGVAQELILNSDRNRSGYTRYLLNYDWMSPLGYDLILNTGSLDEQTCVDFIAEAARLPEIEGRREEGLAVLAVRALAKRVEVTLVRSRQVDARFISVAVPSAGVVELHGMVTSESEKAAATQIVSQIGGVDLVRNELAVTIMPVGQMEPL